MCESFSGIVKGDPLFIIVKQIQVFLCCENHKALIVEFAVSFQIYSICCLLSLPNKYIRILSVSKHYCLHFVIH